MKLRTSQLSLILLLSILIPMGAIIVFSQTQAPSKPADSPAVLKNAVLETATDNCTPPKTRFQFEQRLRSLTVTFTDRDGDTVYWKALDGGVIHLGSFVLSSNTFYTDKTLTKRDKEFFNENFSKGEWGVNYDVQCFIAISATKLN